MTEEKALKCACGHTWVFHKTNGVGCLFGNNGQAGTGCSCSKFNPVIPASEVLKAIDDARDALSDNTDGQHSIIDADGHFWSFEEWKGELKRKLKLD